MQCFPVLCFVHTIPVAFNISVNEGKFASIKHYLEKSFLMTLIYKSLWLNTNLSYHLKQYIIVALYICTSFTECSISLSVMPDSLFATLWLSRFFHPWNSPSRNTGVGCHSFLHGVFPTHGLNPGLLYCRQILYSLSHLGSPLRVLHYP